MKKVEKIWAELSKAKRKGTKLSAKKRNVKLSVVDELESFYEQLEEQTSITSYFAYEWVEEAEEKVIDAIQGLDDFLINSSMSYLADTGKQALEALAKLEQIHKDLGVPMDELYPDYEELKEWAEGAEDLQFEAYEALQRSYLKDLTGFANEIRP
jgi:transcriptional regulator with XRE-family HTH domain